MDFNYDNEKEKLIEANNDINNVLIKYNNIVMNLDDKEKNVILLYYYFMKFDTVKKMTPKGDYWVGRREKYIEMGIEIINNIGKDLFPNSKDLDDIKNNMYSSMTDELLGIINNLSLDIKKAYKKYCSHVYTILDISGLKELRESKHRENQYLSHIYDGVFAISTIEGIEKYIARAIAGGMIVHGNEIEYPKNPFKSIKKDRLLLVRSVSIYLADIELFEPQIDYEKDKHGNFHFIFGGEWVAPYKTINCIEKQTTYLPITFVENNNVFYMDNGRRVQIESNLN